jgi:alkaline phosphatase D
MPIMHQWDDHDTGGNNTDKRYPRWSQSQQVFEEYVPSYPLPAVTPGIWQKFTYAQLDGFILDCRSQRDSNLDPDDSAKSMLDGNALGSTGQLQWLEDSLLESSARWKIVFSSVTVNPSTKFPEGWAGYQTEWNALKAFINTNQISGVVFISGDLHLGAIDDGRESGFPEMSVSQPNGLGGCPTAAYGRWSEGYYEDPNCRGFGLVDVATDPDRLTLEVADEFGDIKISYTVSDGAHRPPFMHSPAQRP